MEVSADEGMRQSFGQGDWQTEGGFLTASRPVGSVYARPVTLYGRGELYDGSATDGSGGHELMRTAAAGFSMKVNDRITWKGEYLWLDYGIPMAKAKSIRLIGYTGQFGLVVTF